MTEIGSMDLKWCCKTTSKNCTLEFLADRFLRGRLEPNKYFNVRCIGKVIPLTEQCHDDDITTPTCNFHPKDETRIAYGNTDYPRSHIDICNNNK